MYAPPSNQLRIVLGPTIAIRNHGYGASEAHMSVFYDPDDTETFVFETEEAIEFVGAEAEGIPSDIVQGVSILQPLHCCDPLMRGILSGN